MGPGGDALPPPLPDPQPVRTLRRSTDDQVIAGVCGGLGRYLGIDPVVIRIAFVVLALVGGSGILAYIIGWLVIPEERSGDSTGRSAIADPAGAERSGSLVGSGSALLGALLVVVGAALLLDQVVPGFRSVLGPLLLIGIGLVVLGKVRR
jgi:phage shock protein C